MARQALRSGLCESVFHFVGIVRCNHEQLAFLGFPKNHKPIPLHRVKRPGQVAFFRPGDRVMITGDAVVTVDINSFGGFLLWSLRINKQRISGPPWYSTLNKQLAKKSVAAIAALEPRVLASGHGVPMQGERTAQELHAFANRYLVSGGKPDKNAK